MRRDVFLCPPLVPARLTEAYRDVIPEEWYRHVTVTVERNIHQYYMYVHTRMRTRKRICTYKYIARTRPPFYPRKLAFIVARYSYDARLLFRNVTDALLRPPRAPCNKILRLTIVSETG